MRERDEKKQPKILHLKMPNHGSQLFVIFFTLVTITSAVSGSRCSRNPEEFPYVLCYYTGQISLNNTNVGNCTHLIFTNAVKKDVIGNGLRLKEGVKKDLQSIKEKDLNVLTVFSLNFDSVESSAILESTNKSKHLIEEITSFMHETAFDGIELNFEFTTQSDGSKDSYTSFVQVLSKSLDSVHRRRKRSSYKVVEEQEDDLTTISYSTSNSETIRTIQSTTQSDIEENFKEIKHEKTSTTEKVIEKKETGNEDVCDNRFWLIIRLPFKLDVLGKKYDLKALSRYADLLSVSTHNIINDDENLTYHPSRLMGLSDVYNTDSILDFMLGMGAVKSRLVIALPASVTKFQLKDQKKNIAGSSFISRPIIIDQSKLCTLFKKGNWTLERDEDLTAPYAYSGDTWLAFEDEISVNIKGKYILLRELAGGAIYPIDDDVNNEKCTNRSGTGGYLTSVLASNFKNFRRKSRATVLESLQNEIHGSGYSSIEAGVKLSNYRIVRVVDHSGAVHVIRRNTKTKFECSRQGYFSHPLGCNKFYRCVKFDHYSDDFTVFEYDCPAGLAFDERWEVCVWPGSLPNGAPCTGSSEIAPVPRSHYNCPNQEGYYGDPENCRWFFACLDHARDGITPLTAYEFRCPFGLVFNEEKLACDWPWIVGSCGNKGRVGVTKIGSSSRVHTTTFLNGGNLEASYGQYGKTDEEASLQSFGRGFGSSRQNTNELSQAGKQSLNQKGGIGYITNHFDSGDSQRAPFGSYPDFEVSGGRVHNKGGVILQENVNFGKASEASGPLNHGKASAAFDGFSFGRAGSLGFEKQSFGKETPNAYGSLSSGSSDFSNNQYSGAYGIPYESLKSASLNEDKSPSASFGINVYEKSAEDLSSKVYKQIANNFANNVYKQSGGASFGSDFGISFGGSGSFRPLPQYAGSDGSANHGSLVHSIAQSDGQSGAQLQSFKAGERTSNGRNLFLSTVKPVEHISQDVNVGHTSNDFSSSDESLHSAYPHSVSEAGSDGLLKDSDGKLRTTLQALSAITPAVTTVKPITQPVSYSKTTIVSIPAATFATPTATPISHTQTTNLSGFRGSTVFGGVTNSLLESNGITTPNPHKSTAGDTHAKDFGQVKTDFEYSGISSTVKPFTASTISSVSNGENALKLGISTGNVVGKTFEDTAFNDQSNSYQTQSFGTYGTSVKSGSGSGNAASVSHKISAPSLYTNFENSAFGSQYGNNHNNIADNNMGSVSSDSFSHLLGKFSTSSSTDLSGHSGTSSSENLYTESVSKTAQSASTGGQFDSGLFSSIGSRGYSSGTAAGVSLENSVHQGESGSGSFKSSNEVSSGSNSYKSSLLNSQKEKFINDGSLGSYGIPLPKTSFGEPQTTTFESINTGSILHPSIALKISDGDSSGQNFGHAISSTLPEVSTFRSFNEPTTQSGILVTGKKSGYEFTGSNAGSAASLGISSTSQTEFTSGSQIGSLIGKTIDHTNNFESLNSGSSVTSFEDNLSNLRKNIGILSSDVSYGATAVGSLDSLKTSAVKSIDSLNAGKTVENSFGKTSEESSVLTKLDSHSEGKPESAVNTFGHISDGFFKHSKTGLPGTTFGVPGDLLKSYTDGSSDTVGGTSSVESLPNKYKDFFKGSFGQTYGVPISNPPLTSYGSTSTSFGEPVSIDFSSHSNAQPDAEVSPIAFGQTEQPFKPVIPSQTLLSDKSPITGFGITLGATTDYDISNGNYLTSPGTLKPVVKTVENFGLEKGSNSPEFPVSVLKYGITGGSAHGQDIINKNPFETFAFSKETYGEAIKHNNPAAALEHSQTLYQNQFSSSSAEGREKGKPPGWKYSTTESQAKAIENQQNSQIQNSDRYGHFGQSYGVYNFNNIQGTGQQFRIVVPNRHLSHDVDSSEKFQHATDVTIEEQPIIQVAGIEPFDYSYESSTQKTTTTKQNSGSSSFGYKDVKNVPSQSDLSSVVTSTPSVTTFAPFTYKHGQTTLQTTSVDLRPYYPEPIIHNRTQLINFKISSPVFPSTTQIPVSYAEASIHSSNPEVSTVSLKAFSPSQEFHTGENYLKQNEVSTVNPVQSHGDVFVQAGVEPELQNVVEVTPKPVVPFHGSFQSTDNQHDIIQSQKLPDFGKINLKQALPPQTVRGHLFSSDSASGTYYNKQLLESTKPTSQTTANIITSTESYLPTQYTSILVQQQPVPVTPEPSLPKTTAKTNNKQQQLRFNQFDNNHIKTNYHQHGSLSYPSTTSHPQILGLSEQPETSSKLNLLKPVSEYGSSSTKSPSSQFEIQKNQFQIISPDQQSPGVSFEYSSSALESYRNFLKKLNTSSDIAPIPSILSYFNSHGIQGAINPNIEINPPPKEYLRDQQESIRNFEKAAGIGTQPFETNNEDQRSEGGFAYKSKGGVFFQEDRNRGKGSYQTTIVGGGAVKNSGEVSDLYRGRYGKLITDEAFGEKLSGLHYDVMKIKTKQKSKDQRYHDFSFSEIPATNKYEEYKIENGNEYEGKGTGSSIGSSVELGHLYDDKKKTVIVSQTSDANPILVGKLAGQCSCQSNLLELKNGRKESSRGKHKHRKQETRDQNESDASGLTSVENPSTENYRETGSTTSGLDGHDVEYTPTASPSFQPHDVVSITPKTKQFRGKARFLSPSSHLYYSGPDTSLPSSIWGPPGVDGESNPYARQESKSENKIHGGLRKVEAGAAFDRYGPGGWRSFDETLQGSVDCKRPGLFRHPKYCNKFYACNYDPWEERFTLHIFNCPIRLTYDNSISACNWPVGGPACADDNLLV